MAVSVLNMRWHASRDAQVREVLRDASERLSYIAAVHEMLYEEPAEAQTVELFDYLTRMRDRVVQARGAPGVDIRVEGEALVIGARCAANLALIACEAISNAYKMPSLPAVA